MGRVTAGGGTDVCFGPRDALRNGCFEHGYATGRGFLLGRADGA